VIATKSFAQSAESAGDRAHGSFPRYAEPGGRFPEASSPNRPDWGDLTAYDQNSDRFGYDPNPIQPEIESTLDSLINETLGRREISKRETPAIAAAEDAATRPTAVGVQNRPKRRALSDYHPPPSPEPFNLGNLLARMTIGTVTVLGVGVVGLLTARRWLPHSFQAGRGEKMKLEESLILGKRCCVHLVSVENRKLVVVMDGGGVKSVETLNEPFPDIASWDSESPDATSIPEEAGKTGP
jgi:hypothetical protein